jgi:glycosyltransferase involved in cell wall biosynthesis
VREPLARLAASHDFTFTVVGLSRPLDWNLTNMLHKPWTLEGELDSSPISTSHHAPARLPFRRGKCAFKIIQYMAAGIPVVASPVGGNLDVVREGENGFLADSAEDWMRALAALLDDPRLRRTMGEAGRRTVREGFSLDGHWKRYAEIIKECL